MDKPTPLGAKGQTIEENGIEYFVYNNVRIKVTEHFTDNGKQISERKSTINIVKSSEILKIPRIYGILSLLESVFHRCGGCF